MKLCHASLNHCGRNAEKTDLVVYNGALYLAGSGTVPTESDVYC